MNFDNLSENQLIEIDRTKLSYDEMKKHVRVLVRKVLWQDIASKGKDYRILSIKVGRSQEGIGLREAASMVDAWYWKNK
jgi:ribosomal protein L7/L12